MEDKSYKLSLSCTIVKLQSFQTNLFHNLIDNLLKTSSRRCFNAREVILPVSMIDSSLSVIDKRIIVIAPITMITKHVMMTGSFVFWFIFFQFVGWIKKDKKDDFPQ